METVRSHFEANPLVSGLHFCDSTCYASCFLLFGMFGLHLFGQSYLDFCFCKSVLYVCCCFVFGMFELCVFVNVFLLSGPDYTRILSWCCLILCRVAKWLQAFMLRTSITKLWYVSSFKLQRAYSKHQCPIWKCNRQRSNSKVHLQLSNVTPTLPVKLQLVIFLNSTYSSSKSY